jgi:hypothetical protein
LEHNKKISEVTGTLKERKRNMEMNEKRRNMNKAFSTYASACNVG